MISWAYMLLTAGGILLLFALVGAFFVGRELSYRRMVQRRRGRSV